MIIDTHCHIYNSEMENAEEIIKEAAENDIHMILNGTDPLSNREILELSQKYENVHAALGYFYLYADKVTDEDIALLDKQLDKDNKDKQKELFEKMLQLAEKHNLPVIVHSRKSIQDTYDILKKHDVVGSMHCYNGSAEMAQEFIKLGFYMGIAGPITHTNNKKIKKIVKKIDINHMLVETDSPYLTPQEKKKEKNTSLNLKYITRKIAEELDMPENQVIEITAENAKRLFKI